VEGRRRIWTEVDKKTFFSNQKIANAKILCSFRYIKLKKIPMSASPQKAIPQSFVIILQIANSQISSKILHKSFSKNNPKNRLLNQLFYYVKI
jgi:hypothetical protein